MKKFNIFKSIQLILFIAAAGVALFIIFTDSRLFHQVATDPKIRLLCFLLWVAFGLSFLFIFMDFSLFSTFKKEYRELDYAVFSDPMSGIANRNSCDAVIEKYEDRPLPKDLGCIMFLLSNIGSINKKYGHKAGNEVIRKFSEILQESSEGQCFVGRNGGNTFLALFETCTKDQLLDFMRNVQKHVMDYNAGEGAISLSFRFGAAFHEGAEVTNINELISLANRRIYQKDEV